MGGWLAALLGAELTGSRAGHSLGAGPSRAGERPGKDPGAGSSSSAPASPGKGQRPGGHTEQGLPPHVLETPGWCPSPCVIISGDFHSQQWASHKCQGRAISVRWPYRNKPWRSHDGREESGRGCPEAPRRAVLGTLTTQSDRVCRSCERAQDRGGPGLPGRGLCPMWKQWCTHTHRRLQRC